MAEPLIISPSGATGTCRRCGTQFDLLGVDITEICPPVGDTCEFCAPDDDEVESDD